MRTTQKKKNVERLVVGDYVLREVFEDSYEYEIYFKLVNSIDISDICPSNFEIDFSTKIKQPRLSFPENDPKLVKIIIPISKAHNNPRKISEIRTQNFHKYADLVPKIKLSLKNQIAALRKDLVNEKEAIFINQEVKKARNIGLKKTKANIKKTKIK